MILKIYFEPGYAVVVYCNGTLIGVITERVGEFDYTEQFKQMLDGAPYAEDNTMPFEFNHYKEGFDRYKFTLKAMPLNVVGMTAIEASRILEDYPTKFEIEMVKTKVFA
jgi:hypothetical protein